MYSNEHLNYIKKLRSEKRTILIFKISIIICFLILWEVLSHYKIINTFLFSSPSLIIKTIIGLYKDKNLFNNIWVTSYETLISFSLATIIGIIIATIMWWNKKLAKIIDPYLTILNSLPKVSLGPLIIIWAGANIKSIILMAILISIFNTIISMYNAFNSTDESKIILLKSFNASKWQIYKKLIFRGNIPTLINVFKINVSMSLIGVIMGELLVSKQGLGYLITYGSQVFNLNLVLSGIIILAIFSYILYIIVSKIEKILIKNK